MGKSQSKDEVKEVEAGEQSRKKDFVSTYCKAMRSTSFLLSAVLLDSEI